MIDESIAWLLQNRLFCQRKMWDLPSDILCEILLRLPAESLFRFRAVCKSWNRIITDPSFIRCHTSNQYYANCSALLLRDSTRGRFYSFSVDSLNYADGLQTIDVTPVEQPCISVPSTSSRSHTGMSSCNGLILLHDHASFVNWVVWDPSSRQFHEVPKPDARSLLLTTWSDSDFASLHGSGFGYDRAADDYKVVSIAKLQRGCGTAVQKFVLYSVRLGSWRVCRDCPDDFLCSSKGVFLNGALHWRSPGAIIALDLTTEEYLQLPGPPVHIPADKRLLFLEDLDVAGGCLFLSCYDHEAKRFDGWVLDEYGVEKSWMKLFSIEERDILAYTRSLRPVVYMKSRRMCLLQYDKGLFWLNLENNSVKNVTIHGLSWTSYSQICPGSLFRLDHDSGSVAVAAKTTARMKEERQRADTRLTFCVRNIGVQPCSDDTCCKSVYSSWAFFAGVDSVVEFFSTGGVEA